MNDPKRHSEIRSRWEATPGLRWFCPAGGNNTDIILQQKWTCLKGGVAEFEWRAVRTESADCADHPWLAR
jgi:hypothetical protein